MTESDNDPADDNTVPSPHEPIDLKRDGDAIVIAWASGGKDRWTPQQLRDACPCATCREKHGKKDAASEEPKRPTLRVLSAAEAQPLTIMSMRPVGNYGYNVNFSDGHSSGIFTFDRLARD